MGRAILQRSVSKVRSVNGSERRLCVLKFGGSVLCDEGDYRTAAQEIYRHVRDGEKIVAIVSALYGETDALNEQAGRVGGQPADAMDARLARIGELRSAALLTLALTRALALALTLTLAPALTH